MIASVPENAACRQCGYLLRDLHEPRCPECGGSFDPSNPLTFEIAGLSRLGRWWRRFRVGKQNVTPWWAPWDGPLRPVDAAFVTVAAGMAVYYSATPFCGCHGLPFKVFELILLLVAAATVTSIPRKPARIAGLIGLFILLLWVRAQDPGWPWRHSAQWFFFLIELLLIGAVAELALRFLVGLHKRRRGVTAKPQTRRRRFFRGVMIVAIALALPIPLWPWPLWLRFRASEHDFAMVAEQVIADGKGSLNHRRIGDYELRAIRLLSGDLVLFELAGQDTWPPEAGGYDGFIYVPDPPEPRWQRIRFAGSDHWYVGGLGIRSSWPYLS